MKPFVVVVDGIISAGKTTYITMLTSHLTKRGWKVTVVKEPVDKWKSTGLLQRFYGDPARWGYHFQTMAFVDRVNENISMFEKYGHQEGRNVFILERSCFTDILFMELLYESKLVDDLEMNNYRDWVSLWRKAMPYEPDLFIYLKPSVEVCMKRIRERNRPGEEGVSDDYQSKLQEKHNNFFINDYVEISQGHYVSCETIETDENFRDHKEVQDKMVDQFVTLIEARQN
jgi:deoxyadenosine/deoxycytidine kinase